MAVVQVILKDTFDDWRLKDNALRDIINYDSDPANDESVDTNVRAIAYHRDPFAIAHTATPVAELTEIGTLVESLNWSYDNIGELRPITIGTTDHIGLQTNVNDNIVNAINEHETQLGQIEEIVAEPTIDADTIVGAILELNAEVGEPVDFNATIDATTVVGAINELDEELGITDDFRPTIDADTVVGAINELDLELGVTVDLDADILSEAGFGHDGVVTAVTGINEVNLKTNTNTTNIGDLTALNPGIVNTTVIDAINSIDLTIDGGWAGGLDDLVTDDKDNIVAAINSLYYTFGDDDGLADLHTVDQSTVVNAMNEMWEIGGLEISLATGASQTHPAINELHGEVDNIVIDAGMLEGRVEQNEDDIGNMANLNGSETNLVDAINSVNATATALFDPIVAAIALG